jgi:hypothetical protein
MTTSPRLRVKSGRSTSLIVLPRCTRRRSTGKRNSPSTLRRARRSGSLFRTTRFRCLRTIAARSKLGILCPNPLPRSTCILGNRHTIARRLCTDSLRCSAKSLFRSKKSGHSRWNQCPLQRRRYSRNQLRRSANRLPVDTV